MIIKGSIHALSLEFIRLFFENVSQQVIFSTISGDKYIFQNDEFDDLLF